MVSSPSQKGEYKLVPDYQIMKLVKTFLGLNSYEY